MISVVIPSRGENVALWCTVASAKAVLEADHCEHEIIVVCNEKDATNFPPSAQFMHLFDMCKVLFTSASGPAEARNMGASKSKGDFLVFSDAHCVFPPKFFTALEAAAREHDADAVFGGTRYCTDVTHGCTVGWDDILWGMNVLREAPDAQPHPIVACGHGVFGIRVADFFDAGGYWKALRGWGGEETQLNLKLWMLGKRLMMIPTLHHFHFAEPGARRGFEMYKERDFVRNFLLVASAYGGEAQAHKSYEAFVAHYWAGAELHKDVLAEALSSPLVQDERRDIALRSKYPTLESLRAMFNAEKIVT